MDNLTYAGNLKNLTDEELNAVTFVKEDICNFDKIVRYFRNIDVVVNFAAESHVDRSITNSDPFIQTNIVGTHSLLSASIKNDIKKYIQVSTDEVYGTISEGSWDENFNLRPNSPYSASKASADLLVQSFSKTHGLNTTITRCSNNYGPQQHIEKLIPKTITNFLSGIKVPIYGNGLNVREWIHVSDHCRAIECIMLNETNDDVYNIGSKEEISNIELITKILKMLGGNNESIEYVEDRKGHDQRYSLNDTKFRNEFKLNNLFDLESGLQNTINWYQENRSWWTNATK